MAAEETKTSQTSTRAQIRELLKTALAEKRAERAAARAAVRTAEKEVRRIDRELQTLLIQAGERPAKWRNVRRRKQRVALDAKRDAVAEWLRTHQEPEHGIEEIRRELGALTTERGEPIFRARELASAQIGRLLPPDWHRVGVGRTAAIQWQPQ